MIIIVLSYFFKIELSLQDFVQLIDKLEIACIRFVHFSQENEVRSRVSKSGFPFILMLTVAPLHNACVLILGGIHILAPLEIKQERYFWLH